LCAYVGGGNDLRLISIFGCHDVSLPEPASYRMEKVLFGLWIATQNMSDFESVGEEFDGDQSYGAASVHDEFDDVGAMGDSGVLGEINAGEDEPDDDEDDEVDEPQEVEGVNEEGDDDDDDDNDQEDEDDEDAEVELGDEDTDDADADDGEDVSSFSKKHCLFKV